MEISELMQRYGLSSRQSLYARLKSLELVLEKGDRNKINASPEQVELLDELDEHLKKGGSLKSFLPSVNTTIVPDVELPLDNSLDIVSNETQLLEMLVGAIVSNIQPRSPLWYHEELEKAAESGLLLTSKEIKALIGVQPKCRKGESSFTRGSWRFIKTSKKIGSSVGWLVEIVNIVY